jgi:hypothetical protein
MRGSGREVLWERRGCGERCRRADVMVPLDATYQIVLDRWICHIMNE